MENNNKHSRKEKMEVIEILKENKRATFWLCLIVLGLAGLAFIVSLNEWENLKFAITAVVSPFLIAVFMTYFKALMDTEKKYTRKLKKQEYEED